MYHFTALVTCLAILFYFFTSIRVSKARAASASRRRRSRAIPISSGCFACR